MPKSANYFSPFTVNACALSFKLTSLLILDEVEKRAHKNINLYSIIVISRVYFHPYFNKISSNREEYDLPINPNRLNAVRVSFDGY